MIGVSRPVNGYGHLEEYSFKRTEIGFNTLHRSCGRHVTIGLAHFWFGFCFGFFVGGGGGVGGWVGGLVGGGGVDFGGLLFLLLLVIFMFVCFLLFCVCVCGGGGLFLSLIFFSFLSLFLKNTSDQH